MPFSFSLISPFFFFSLPFIVLRDPLPFSFCRYPFGLGLQSPALNKERLLFDRFSMCSSTASENPDPQRMKRSISWGPRNPTSKFHACTSCPGATGDGNVIPSPRKRKTSMRQILICSSDGTGEFKSTKGTRVNWLGLGLGLSQGCGARKQNWNIWPFPCT